MDVMMIRQIVLPFVPIPYAHNKTTTWYQHTQSPQGRELSGVSSKKKIDIVQQLFFNMVDVEEETRVTRKCDVHMTVSRYGVTQVHTDKPCKKVFVVDKGTDLSNNLIGRTIVLTCVGKMNSNLSTR